MKLMKRFKAPTPWKFRRIGWALLAVASFITGGGLMAFDSLKEYFDQHSLKIIIGVSFVAGIVGKFLTELFKDDSE